MHWKIESANTTTPSKNEIWKQHYYEYMRVSINNVSARQKNNEKCHHEELIPSQTNKKRKIPGDFTGVKVGTWGYCLNITRLRDHSKWH